MLVILVQTHTHTHTSINAHSVPIPGILWAKPTVLTVLGCKFYHWCLHRKYREALYCVGVVAIPGCQLDNIWNELQSGIGRLTSDPYLEAWRSLSGSWFEDLEPQWLWIPED